MAGIVPTSTSLDILEALIRSFGLPAGTANSLLAKVHAAEDSVARGNTAACNQLQPLVHETQAQAGQHLMAAQSAAIVAAAQQIRAALGCSGRSAETPTVTGPRWPGSTDTIRITCTDNRGQATTRTVTVSVPHDQR